MPHLASREHIATTFQARINTVTPHCVIKAPLHEYSFENSDIVKGVCLYSCMDDIPGQHAKQKSSLHLTGQ